MKKTFLLLIIPVLLCGCEKNNSENKVNRTESKTTTTTITTTSSTTTTTTTTTTKKQSTTIKKTEPKNLYTSSYDNKQHKYSYVYGDNDTCRKKGNAIFLEVADNVNKDVMVYDCEKVTDASGKVYYGLFFYTDTRDDARFYY